jgi:hypothetical protein
VISVPVSTVERPVTVIDFIAGLYACASVTEVESYNQQCPAAIRDDARFVRAVALRVALIKAMRTRP